jgi:hypothetical protein
MSDDRIKRLATEQRKRLVAGLLNAVEGTAWHKKLLPAERDAYRKEVFERVGIYHDFMLDVIKVADDEGMVNGQALELVEQVHQSQQRLERAIRRPVVPSG